MWLFVLWGCSVVDEDGCYNPNHPAVDYQSQDDGECQAINFFCGADEVGFVEPDCGCGCVRADWAK